MQTSLDFDIQELRKGIDKLEMEGYTNQQTIVILKLLFNIANHIMLHRG